MSDTPTFRLGDLVWIATVSENLERHGAVLHTERFTLLHGIVKKVKRDGNLISVLWHDNEGNVIVSDHIATNLAYTSDEAIRKFSDWAVNVLNSQKHDYESQAVEKQAKIQASEPAPTVVVHKLDEEQLNRIIQAIKEKP